MVSSPAGPAITVDALHRSFEVGRRARRRTIDAVNDLTFDAERGERLAFIGPNGAGKSTSIKMLTGILAPTGGRAQVLGITPWEERRRLSIEIGVLFGQRSQLWDELPPRSSLRVLGAVFGLDDPSIDRRLSELGEVLDATELLDQPIRTQSLGQRMRCELAACLLHEPSLLFLDEPTIGLDLLGKQLFRDLLVRLNEHLGTTVFLTSHDVADVEHVAKRVIVVNHGTIIYDASVAAMRRDLLSTKRIEVGLAHPVDRSELDGGALDSASGTSIVSLAGSQLRLEVDTTTQPIGAALDAVLDTLPVADLSVVDPPLEHVIGEIYRQPR